VLNRLQEDLTELSMNTRVGQLVRRSPLVCLPDTALQQVFEEMDRESAGSMLVADEAGKVQGIITRYDLIRRIILPQIPLSTPIREVMSIGIRTIDANSSVLEALLMMARHNIRHLPVLQHDFLVGLVSERDLVQFQRSSLRILSSTIDKATSISDLKSCSNEILALARRLMAQGVAATSLARLVSHLNDALTRRLIMLTETRLREQSRGELPPWCWLALGSEGREEQTVATDQDNAIIFEGDGDIWRERFMAFAAEVNQGLADIGFPLCKGGVMAMHAKWCRSVEEWHELLGRWFHSPMPEALLDANIFFDFRGLHGETRLASELRSWLSSQVAEHRLFLRSLAQDAMRDEVAQVNSNGVRLSLARALRRRGQTANWLSPAGLDMKRGGTAPVVYFTRILALARGLPATSTDERLKALAGIQAMPESESQQMRDAFDVLQRFRLRAQLAYVGRAATPEGQTAPAADDSPNRLALDDLSHHEVEQLSDALATLAGLRSRIEMDFLR
jgi:CBS domain-containing protein